MRMVRLSLFAVLNLVPGKGAVYGYDAVGSYKRDEYGAMGSGQNFIMPILDNLVRNLPISLCDEYNLFVLLGWS